MHRAKPCWLGSRTYIEDPRRAVEYHPAFYGAALQALPLIRRHPLRSVREDRLRQVVTIFRTAELGAKRPSTGAEKFHSRS